MPKETKSSGGCQTGCSKNGCRISLFLIHSLFTTIYAFVLYRTYFGQAIPVHKPQGKLFIKIKIGQFTRSQFAIYTFCLIINFQQQQVKF